MQYRFIGHDTVNFTKENPDYPGITNPFELYDVLSTLWCRETCAPRMQKDWSEDNITWGQCSITAFLVQDIFGGKVYGIPLNDGSVHCYNEVDGQVFDLTSEQFLPQILSYQNNPEQFREVHFAKQEKYQRYLLLKQKLNDKLKNNNG